MNTKISSTYILLSLTILSVALFAACAPTNKDFVLTQPEPTVENLDMDFDPADLISGELTPSDISAARQAAHYLTAALQTSGELDIADIAAARQAAQVLSRIKAANTVDFDPADLISGELTASDISAARQAAHYLAAALQTSGELDAVDIEAAKQAAERLNHILITGERYLDNAALQRTAAEQDFAHRFEAS